MLNCSSNWPRDVYGEKLAIMCIAKVTKIDQTASWKWCAGKWPSMYVTYMCCCDWTGYGTYFWAKNMIHTLSTQCSKH